MSNHRFFASDNNASVHPAFLERIEKANNGHALAYGDDMYTQQAIKDFKATFGSDIEVFFTFLGTGANVLGISQLIRPFHTVLCAETSHINEDECGAVERFSGSKLIPIATVDGKLTVDVLQGYLKGIGFEHHSQVKLVSLTQSTELGTVYTSEEIKEITNWAHQNNLYVHMDGARIANAAAYLQCSLASITNKAGIDVLSFGGTKNGMMYGEAVVFFHPQWAENFKYVRKQGMQLASKMRYIATQFSTYLDNDFWRTLAEQANAMALLLVKKIENIPEIKILYTVQSNAVFVQLPPSLAQALQAQSFFYPWDEDKHIYRWMCSWDTTKEDVEYFYKAILKNI